MKQTKIVPIRKQFKATGKFHAGVEKSPKEEQEYGPGKKNIVLCKNCEAVYANKSWHHGLQEYKNIREDARVVFTICPACQMIADHAFEGEVVLENVPGTNRDEVIRNIKNTGALAYERDPMDRVISIKEEGGRIEVKTTENQLARAIAREVAQAYKGATVQTRWSKEESVVRLKVTFRRKENE